MRRAVSVLVLAAAACSEPPPPAPPPVPASRVARLERAVEARETEATPPASDAPLALAAFEAVGPAGPTAALALRYALPARIASRYAPVTRGIHLLAFRAAPEPRAWIAPLTREGSLREPAGGGAEARGALVIDPRALLGLPGDEAEYVLVAWIDDQVALVRARLPVSDDAARPSPLPPPAVGLSITEPAHAAGDAPVIRPAGGGCLDFAVDVPGGEGPLALAAVAPELARARAFAVERPHGHAAAMSVGVSACELFVPLPSERLEVFVLALLGDAVVTAALDPALPPPSARPIAAPPCDDDEECVLVTGGCGGPAATHRAVAAAVDEQNRARLAVMECDVADRARVPVRAVCRARTCTTEPLDHPEWRACRRDADCTLEHRDCVQWEPIARSAAQAARAAWVGAPCPGIVPLPPEVRCVYGSCAIGWAGR